MTQEPDRGEGTAAVAAVTVTVERSGGIAGMTRRWTVVAPPADPAPWLRLVEDCPWDDPAPPTAHRAADRFSYRVSARVPGAEHRAEIAESDASGPWRDLIDAVRASSSRA
ncbi:MAG: hypothetical protein J0I43_13955 [Microbacterium sp.]|uniref:protealysin inhibitor emfourin n=1 Tax=Microbacterium sp. TaxID=51671 RepID=UPI001AD187A6|nr:protealysin inhibitor emfourin [Microbacterium sp.]MBN9178451.1 hypothetical protein [Microbacterium sp.]